MSNRHIDQQTVTFSVSACMPKESFASWSWPLRIPGPRIGTESVCRVGPLLAPGIDPAGAVSARAQRLAIFVPEALERRPGFDQGIADGEVLFGQLQLRRDRGPAADSVHRLERDAHRGQHRIGLGLNGPPWMLRRNAFFAREVTEQDALEIHMTTHSCSPGDDVLVMTAQEECRSGYFSTTS